MNFKITFASQDESFPLQLGEVTARIVPADPDLQDKTVTPTESTQTVTCDAPHDGLGTVTVNPIPEEYVIPSGTVELSSNGQHDVSGKAVADVHVEPVLQRKSVTPTRVAQTVEPDSGKDGLSAVEVGGIPSEYVIPEGTVNLSSNGQHDVSGKASAVVNVQPVLQSKSVTPTRAAQTVTPDSGKDGLSTVEVGGIPSEYVIPTGTKQIAANGTHDVSGFASAEVAVPGPTGQIEITENGEVDVAAFASALVNVAGGGASNVVTGTFVGEAKGSLNIPLNYSGNGYPLAVVICISEGAGNIDGAFRNVVSQKSLYAYVGLKNNWSVAPAYPTSESGGSVAERLGTLIFKAKSSSSDATQVSYTGNNTSLYVNVDASSQSPVRIRSNTMMAVYIAASGVTSFKTGYEYTYFVIYSE